MAEQEQKQNPEAQQPPREDAQGTQQQAQEGGQPGQGEENPSAASAAAGTTAAAAAAPWYARAPFWIILLLLLALLAGLGWLIYQKYSAEKLETARQEKDLAALKAYNDCQEEYLRKLRALLQEAPCDIPALLAQIEPPAGTGLPALPGNGGDTDKAQGQSSGQSGAQSSDRQAGDASKTQDKAGTGRSGEPLQIPREAVPDAGTSTAPASPARPEASQARAPQRLEAKEPANVAELLEQNTVLILALMGKGISMGTGFFISQDTIMTNAHVVGNATEVVYINKFVGTVRAASVLLRVREQGLDFAVLKTREPIPVKPLKLQKDLVKKMEKVSAWGFPSAVMSDDPKFLGLLQGNMQAAPEVVYTEGSVNVVLNRKPPLVVHSATVSQGNSGGPLVNEAGDVVGINTMIKLDDQSYRQSSLAIPSTVIAAFLEANGVPYTPAQATKGTGGAR